MESEWNIRAIWMVKSVLILVGVWLCYTNFIFSESFEVLTLREIDDLAFQFTLRKMHIALNKGHLRVLFGTIDYGYGNFFWLTITFLTYPFYLMDLVQPIIVLPRLFSLGCFFISAFLVNKMLKELVGDRLVAHSVSLLVLLTPVVVYAAQRFHNHGLITLLGCLALWFCFFFKGPWGRLLAFGLCGLAAGVKLTGLFVFPIIFFGEAYNLFRKWKSRSNTLSQEILSLIFGSLVFIVSAFSSLSPLFLVFPKAGEQIEGIFKTLDYYFQNSKNNLGSLDNQNPVRLIKEGFLGMIFSWPIWVCFFVGAILELRKALEKQALMIGILISLSLVGGYLTFKTAQGPWAISNYFIPVAFGSAISLVGLRHVFSKENYRILILLLLLLQVVSHREELKTSFFLYWDRNRSTETQEKIRFAVEQKKIFEKYKSSPSILKDFRVLSPLSVINCECEIKEIFDNIHVFFDHPSEFDFIILNRESILFSSDEKLNLREDKQELFKSKKVVEGLMERGQFFGRSYQLLLEQGPYILFGKRSLVK